MSLPIDRTTLTAAATNQVPNAVLQSAKNIAAITAAFNGVDEVYNYATGLVSASTLSRLGIINVKDYNASGLATTATGSITTGTKILTLTTTPDFVAGQGINLQGAFEVASLLVGAGASSSANCTITLNGVAFTVALTSGATAAEVATAIRAGTFTGWTAGGTALSTTVTFTSNTTGTKTDASYSAGTTGATGTMTTTTQGTADQISTVASVSGLVVNIADNSTRTIAAGTMYHDDTASINLAIAVANAARISRASVGGSTFIAEQPVVFFPASQYLLSSKLTITEYTSLRGEQAILKKSSAYTSSDFAITSSVGGGWMLTIEGLQFEAFENALYLDNNNLDQGLVNIKNCKFYGITDTAIKLDTQSSIVNIKNCKFDTCVHVLEIVTGDQVNFSESWIKQGTLLISQDATIINTAGRLHMEDILGVPKAVSSTAVSETAWINNYRDVLINRCRFGGETGSKTVVNNYATADVVYPVTSTVVSIKNSQCYQVDNNGGATRCAVRLYAVPNQIIIEGNVGFVDSVTIGWGLSITPATIVAASAAALTVSVEQNSGNNLVPNELLPYMFNRTTFNSRQSTLAPVVEAGTNFTGTLGAGRFNFDINLVASSATNARRMYMVEFTTNSSAGSSGYLGSYMGLLVVTAEFSGGAVNFKVNLIQLLNIGGGLTPATPYVVSAHFGNADTGLTTVAYAGVADRTISVIMDRVSTGGGYYRVYQTTDGTFKI